MRITDKRFSFLPPKNIAKWKQNYYNNIENKLRKLEDNEEELGVELSVLSKAFNEGSCGVIWMFIQNDYNEEYKKGLIKPFIINYFAKKPNERSFYLSVYDSLTCKNYIVDIKDYGKTWALTREALENGKTNK